MTRLSQEETGGLGAIELLHPAGTFAPSPATRIAVEAVAAQGDELTGTGVDWGCGVGALAIAAARVGGVDHVIGLDISETNVSTARKNAVRNGVAERAMFAVADSFRPREADAADLLGGLVGGLDFLVANPPASRTRDGLDFRRRLLREGAEFLKPGGLVLVQVLSAYGDERVQELAADEYRYEGVVRRTPLRPLDFGRGQLRWQLAAYVREERRGGRPYRFLAGPEATGPLSAREALRRLRRGETLLGRWQVHRFRRRGPSPSSATC